MTRTLPTEPIAPYKLSHVVLRTAHLAETLRHYELLLNAHVVRDDSPIAVVLAYDEEHHRMMLVGVPPAPADHGTAEHVHVADDTGTVGVDVSAAPGLEHVAFTFGSLGALLGMYTRAKAAGVKPVWCVNHGPTLSLYYADPDGHKSEMMIDTMPLELCNDYIISPESTANGIGWPFDPDELVASYEAGTPLVELMTFGRDQYFAALTAAS
jgi:catechol 2,3-dioxygenase-like lactoylglutathione lyase family enzyme